MTAQPSLRVLAPVRKFLKRRVVEPEEGVRLFGVSLSSLAADAADVDTQMALAL